MAKGKRRRPRREAATVDYVDAEGNTLSLRDSLSRGTIAKIGEGPATAATSLDDAWRRRTELLFERLAVSWEIAGLPLTDQKMLLGRYRLADAATQQWVRETISAHVDRHIPELSEQGDRMLADAETFSGFAADDLEKAREFYGEILGLEVELLDAGPGLLTLHLPGGRDTLIYGKKDNRPANHTILNFRVDDIDATVDELTARGVVFERYEGMPQDEKGVMRGHGPDIAWFKDPAGNTLSVLRESQLQFLTVVFFRASLKAGVDAAFSTSCVENAAKKMRTQRGE